MVRSSCKRPRLIKVAGAISRFRSIITTAVPPAIIFASSFSEARSATASSSLAGCKSFMFGIIVSLICYSCPHGNRAAGHFFKQHLAEAEGRRALDLQFAEAWVDYFAGVKFSVDSRHIHLAGFGIDFHLTHDHCGMPFR